MISKFKMGLSVVATCLTLIPLIEISINHRNYGIATLPVKTKTVSKNSFEIQSIVQHIRPFKELKSTCQRYQILQEINFSFGHREIENTDPNIPSMAHFFIEHDTDDHDGIEIIEFIGGFEYLYFPKDPPSLSEIGNLHGYRYIINGSFFDGVEENATHAGWLKISDTIYSPIKRDKQLTHIAVLDAENKLNFYDYQSFKTSQGKDTIEFQTGPLVLDKNRVAYHYINNSLNGNGEYKRTLIGFTEDGNKYFIVATIPVTLSELANTLLKRSIFRGKTLSVVNLDGGTSVALYVRDNPNLNFNAKDKLPLLLVVK